MIAALRTEYRKLVTTRLWWVLLVVMVVYMGFLAAVLAWAFSQGQMTTGTQSEAVTLTDEAIVRAVYTVAVSLGYVFPLIVGSTSMAAEFRHKTITPTLLAEPRRDVVLGAKLAAGVVVGLAFGLAGTFASTALGAGVLALLGKPTGLDAASTWRTLGLSVVALAVWCVVGVALGTAVTSQVAVIVVALAFTQFVEPILRTVLALTSWGQDIAKFLPGAAGEAISGGSIYSSFGLSTMLPWWGGLLVLCGYAAVLALIGRLTTLRADIT